MEVKLLVCGVLLVSFMVTGSDAQLDVCGIAPLNPGVGAAGKKEVTNNNDKTLQPLSSPADVTDDIKPAYLPPGSSVSTTIVGGNDAPAGSWPWQVYLYNGRVACGGSLINNQWVLTAAHCFDSADGLTVRLGADTLRFPNPDEETRTVSRLINHPNYDARTKNNDIALLQLSSPVNFTDYIRPVCLAAGGSVFNEGTKVWITGWGRIHENIRLPYPKKLQEVNVPIVSNRRCQADYKGHYNMSNMMCAGLKKGGKDSCQGDSGGPLVVKNGNDRWIQGGVVSFGRGCARPNFPGVYTRVSSYQSWINSHITGFIKFP